MPTPSALQISLLARQPELDWLLDPNGDINGPLFDQWGLKLLQHAQNNKGLSDVKDAVLWGLEKNVDPKHLQNGFNWLHKYFVTSHTKNKEATSFFSEVKQKYPDALQQLLSNTRTSNSVWNTALLMKYAPDPKKMWESNPNNTAYYTGTTPLSWSKKETQHDNCSPCAYPTEDTIKTMHDVMGPKAFALWQYGAFMHLLSLNIYSSEGPPSGKKYGAPLAFDVLEPAIRLGLAPDPQTLALDTVRRYKGKGLVEDLLIGLNHAMDKYEAEDNQDGLKYCSTMLNNIIPFAIRDGLSYDINASGVDTRLTHGLAHNRLDQAVAESWFEDRLRHGHTKRPLNIQECAGVWPRDMQERLFALQIALHHDPSKTVAGNTIAFLQRIGFNPALVPVVLDSLSDDTWHAVQKELDSNDETSSVVSLLRTKHPRIDAYKNSPRARTAITVACMYYVNQPPNTPCEPKYRQLAGLLYSSAQNGVGALSLPQPLAYFASCFPQYRETWRALAQDMANTAIAKNAAEPARVPGHSPEDAHQVINAVASLMLGKSVDAQSLLQVRNMLDSAMSYEELVQTQMQELETFKLPETFDAAMFSADNLGPTD